MTRPDEPKYPQPEPPPTPPNPNYADKRIFTTGEAAEICKVSQQTIIRCFDAGRLNGFRVPGSKFRRIPRDELLRFMRDNDIPTTAIEGVKRRILVVDDDPEILSVFTDLFERDSRFHVQTASTGYDAGMLTESFEPNLIVLDYMLPDINGNVVCARVRANPKHQHARILIVSGVVNQAEVDQLLKSGADDFIKKPFDLATLMQRIERLLDLTPSPSTTA
jgi:excisionase family DNA binding protein